MVITRLVLSFGLVGLTKQQSLIAFDNVADHPARGVSDGIVHQLLAWLQGNGGDVSGRGVQLVECALLVRKILAGVDEAVGCGLDASVGMRRLDCFQTVERSGSVITFGRQTASKFVGRPGLVSGSISTSSLGGSAGCARTNLRWLGRRAGCQERRGREPIRKMSDHGHVSSGHD